MLSWKLLICQNRILKENGGMKLCEGESLTTLDIDWTTLLTYSEKKEGAQRGMNKKKKGKPCFQLSLSFIENLFVDSKLCPGLSNPKNLLQQKVKRAMTLGYKFSAVRADSAYGSTENLRYLQSLSLYYAIGATHTYKVIKQARQTFKQQVRKKGAPGIIHISEGLQAYDFGTHNITKEGEQPLNCRIITCRRIQRTKKKGKWIVKSYYYSILTNLDWSVKQVVKYYHLRNRIENGIKELKYHYHLERLPATELQANEFYIVSKIVAMTMIKLFAINNLPKALQSMWRKTLLRKIFGRHLLVLQGEKENILIVEIRLKCPYSWHFKRILKKLLLDHIRQNSRSAVA
jgi:transposase